MEHIHLNYEFIHLKECKNCLENIFNNIFFFFLNNSFNCKYRFFFDYKSSPGFELIYVLNITYNLYIAMFYAALDNLFVALCLHIVGSLKILENDFIELDNDYEEK